MTNRSSSAQLSFNNSRRSASKRRAPAGEKFLNADSRVAGGHYFQAMGIPLRQGRFFNEQDVATNPRVVIIDERMA
ncbi:MAG: ABC transporter permease, partial [Acidobacteriia bacterium]|nr:ABC transporter permease [Terriglobia bacterium]